MAESSKDSQNQQSSLVLAKPAGENTGGKLAKSLQTRWITVDENEFRHIQNVFENKGSSFDLKIVEKRGGLFVIEADEEQILDLSRNMHEEFNKCAGFMAHQTFHAARLSIDEALRADSSQQLVEYTINNQATNGISLGDLEIEMLEDGIFEISCRTSPQILNKHKAEKLAETLRRQAMFDEISVEPLD